MINEQDKQNFEKAKELLENDMSAIGYDLWIKPLNILDNVDGTIYIEAPSETAKNQLNKIYRDTLVDALTQSMQGVVDFIVISENEKQDFLDGRENALKQNSVKPRVEYALLNPKYTFDTFVVGNSNKYAFAACKNVAEHPSTSFNPLFIYGGVGLGKTHLLHAIGNWLLSQNSETKVCYVTCEKFTNDYVESLIKTRDKTTFDFREKYRNVDVLMIDDIQFISNKSGMQEEFFHTFNDLYQNGKQIIIASDRSPNEIALLEDRLRSRFASGLTQDLQNPDYETRLAILKKKAEIERYHIQPEALEFIADKIDTNIRVLEGVLSKVVFFASLTGKAVATMSDAHEALKEQIQESTKGLTLDLICDTVCSFYKVSKEELLGKKKNKEIVDPRQMCMYIMTELLDTPLTAIGEYFGGRDHTTVMHARDKIGDQIKTNIQIKNASTDIKAMLKR